MGARLAPFASATLAGVVASGLIFYLSRYEEQTADALFAAAICLSIGATIAILTQRMLFSVVAVAHIVALVHIVSTEKQNATGITLHAYDLVRVATSWPTVVGLVSDHWRAVGVALAAAAVSLAFGWFFFRVDGTQVRRSVAASTLLAAMLMVVVASGIKGPRRHTEFFWENISLSTFLASFRETADALIRGSVIEAAPRAADTFPAAFDCQPTTEPPNIVLIHQESVVPPSYFPRLEYDRRLDQMFRSHDGRIHRMRVPTYGGASWLTEFSVLTGLSSDAFGGMRQMVQPVMTGRVGETLPQALARCGYRTQMYYPMLKSFLSTGRFFSSIGIGEIFDAKDQEAKQANERDRFYFDSMMAQMERHFASGSGPLFAFVETMATHGAYDYVYMPEVDVPPGGPGTPPEMSEYLRRLGMSRMDHEYLRAELQRRFPGRPFLIVHYGDHHPTASRALLGLPPEADIEQVMAADIPLRLITYYAVDGVGYAPPALPDLDLVDSAYLGTIVLQSARLPPSEVYQERARLMRVCYGAYYSCPKRDEILRFHRRLIESGIIPGL